MAGRLFKAMNKINLVKFVIVFLVVILSLIGLSASTYSWQKRKFYINYGLLIWCIAVILIFMVVYISRLYNEIVLEELDLKNAVKLYYYVNIIAAIVNSLSQLMNCKAAVNFYNQVQLFGILNYLDIEVKTLKSAALLVMLKAIIFPIVIEIALILKHMRDNVEGATSLLSTIYVLYPVVAANLIPNCLFGAFVICRQLLLALNHQLRSLEKEANFLQIRKQIHLHKHFYRMQKFCNLADKLDEISEKYSLICFQELNYTNLCAIPLVVSLLHNLFGITVGCFLQYYALADTLINEESYDAFNALTNGVFLVISYLEISLHSMASNQNITAAKETGLILKRIKLKDTDIRFRQAVEEFSYKIIVINFKIQPMGLLNIDLYLMHRVLSAVTSFLLILIQSDLALRFSLK